MASELFRRFAGCCAFLSALVLETQSPAATVTVDPVTPLTNYWAGGEWNVDGDFGGWTTLQITNAVVTGGVLTCSASDADSQVSRINFVGGADLDLGFNDYLDVRVQLPQDYLGDVRNVGLQSIARARGNDGLMGASWD